MIGGYVHGTIGAPASDQDIFRVSIPQSGQYTFETSGWIGACGFALEEDTRLDLTDATGALLATNDDIDAAALKLCSRITALLAPGTYNVAVRGSRGGRYRLQARAGS